MMDKQAAPANWRTNLLITGGVLLTVVVALLLSQFDALQVRLPPTPAQLLAQIEETRRPATAVALTNTPLPAITLADPSATPLPKGTPTGSSQGTILCGPIPAGWGIYEVRSGDSLLALSAISGASVAEISRVNCLQNGLLVEGMRIYLPVRRPTAVICGPPWGWTQYRVVRGDTMFALALRHGTTVYAIMQANCLSDSALIAGRTIFLPPLWATATPIRPLPTATLLATATPTLTPTGTGTAVFTPTPTPGGTPIITVTATLPATVSPTVSPTSAATGEPTVTPTVSATPEPSATPPPATTTATSEPPPSPTATSAPPTATTAPPTATTAPDP